MIRLQGYAKLLTCLPFGKENIQVSSLPGDHIWISSINIIDNASFPEFKVSVVIPPRGLPTFIRSPGFVLPAGSAAALVLIMVF